MKVRFWGTRGSIPISLTAAQSRAKLVSALQLAVTHGLNRQEDVETFISTQLPFEISGTFGGHSSCVQLESEGAAHVFLDFGTGARPLAGDYLKRFPPHVPQTYHVFMSHVHWDHIMGFPFFTPVYIPGNRIVIHTCHAHAEQAFRTQQSAPCFPVPFEALSANIEFDVLQPGQRYDIAGFSVQALLQLHSGDSYGWRFERHGKAMVYSTDSEHKLDDPSSLDEYVKFFSEADLVVFDAMYSLADAISVRADWGHSSNLMGIELCQAANARRLCMFHHEPAYDDAKLAEVLAQTRQLEAIYRTGAALEVSTAYDGLEITL
ncbi:MBL fold metallo-hydrolase [Rhodoferax sp.]|uniref:MBL fold metallo-hydrolase n=1 Tax=Rhodoferax sp. TaxID=50421 RepID=UPI00261BD31E|nr:MBL fold metallo-hydrolase [Rhodoferax sp.]MDD2811287.1 MBL fold metallo-hydrolase [Rhodoferax sp.]MDD5478853.1 MBL fold metallo-hydrolase [Rhodoferax sp.]